MSTSPSLTLLHLDEDSLSAIYSHLGTKEDRISFFHTCKYLHDILRGKVYKLVLHVQPLTQSLSVDDALRTFPGAVLRSIKLVGPIPWTWPSLDGPLQHAAHVTELDVAQPLNYELLDIATLCRIFPGLTSLRVLDKWTTMGKEALRPLQHLQHPKQLALLQSSPNLDDLREDIELILATCHQLESLTLTYFPRHSREVRLQSRSLRHICITHMHATALCDLCWHLEHDAFPNLESITIGEDLILCDLEHLDSSTVEMKLGARLFGTNLVSFPDTMAVHGFSPTDFNFPESRRRQGLGKFAGFAPVLSALIEGGMAQGRVQHVSSLHLNFIYLSCTLLSLLGEAFPNVRQLTLRKNVVGSECEFAHCVTAFPLLHCLKMGDSSPWFGDSYSWNVLSSMMRAAQRREITSGLQIILLDTSMSRKAVDKAVEYRALCEGLGCVTFGFSST